VSERHGTWEEAVRWLLSEPQHAQLVLDCYYDQPVTAAGARFAASPEWQATLRVLPDSAGKALDLGAGHGVTAFALAEAGWEVTAIEPNASELVGCGAIRRLSAAAARPIEVIQGVGESIPFPAGTFDLVYCRQALHHAADIRAFCREAARVLKPGGVFLAAREHVISSPRDLQRFLETHPLQSLYGGENAYPRSQYLQALRQAGLRVIRILGSLDSVINYAPQTRETIRAELLARCRRVPGARAATRRLIAGDASLDRLLRLLSPLDHRAGRLNSFLCVRQTSLPN
jgi:ubiquinone/menaquinone biosynthesis C-methylase UbiE